MLHHTSPRHGSFNTLCRLSFASSSRPSSLQVSTILSLVNSVSLLYKLFDRQCYWYADTVWRSLKRIFPENEELCYDHNARSRYGPFLLGPSDESVDVVCNRYESAWDITLKQWTQARDRHAAQRAQVMICSKDGLPQLSIVFLAVSRRRACRARTWNRGAAFRAAVSAASNRGDASWTRAIEGSFEGQSRLIIIILVLDSQHPCFFFESAFTSQGCSSMYSTMSRSCWHAAKCRIFSHLQTRCSRYIRWGRVTGQHLEISWTCSTS